MIDESIELDGLNATLDKLVHHKEKSMFKGSHLHAFIYFITIHNLSDRKVTLLGRKWILTNADGSTTVVEGDKIVGETPVIDPVNHFLIIVIMLRTYQPRLQGPFMDMMNLIKKYM